MRAYTPRGARRYRNSRRAKRTAPEQELGRRPPISGVLKVKSSGATILRLFYASETSESVFQDSRFSLQVDAHETGRVPGGNSDCNLANAGEPTFLIISLPIKHPAIRDLFVWKNFEAWKREAFNMERSRPGGPLNVPCRSPVRVDRFRDDRSMDLPSSSVSKRLGGLPSCPRPESLGSSRY